MSSRTHGARTLADFAVWSGVILLVIIGVGAAVGRGLFRADFGLRADPVRRQVLRSLDLVDPLQAQRREELDRFDRRYATHPVTTILHVLPGGILLVLAPLQFSSRIRSRHIRFHRWSGRFLMLAALVTTAAGLYFGLRMPYGGAGEATAIAFFGGFFVFAIGRAFVAIRTGRVALHREWVIRAFSIAIGVSTVRVVGALLDVALTPSGTRPADVFALSLWIGWGATLAAGELWIRYTRAENRAPDATAIAGDSVRRAAQT